MTVTDEPLVSVVLLTYDRPEFVRDALDSIRSQTYPRLEIIISDDGSTNPEMVELLEELSTLDATILRNPHGGVSSSAHFGMAAATGEYAMIMGDDDLLEPPYIAEAVTVMETDPDAGFVYCRADFIGTLTGPWRLPDFHIGGVLLNNQIFATFLFHREDWSKTGGYDLSMTEGREDHDFVLKLLSIGRRPLRLDGTYFHYRRHSGPSVNDSAVRTRNILVQNHATIFRNNLDLYADHAEEFWHEIFSLVDEATDLKHRYASLERARTKHPRVISALRGLMTVGRRVVERGHRPAAGR